ncbi:hypothetical protein U2A404250010 [Corynebacterium striatum]|nr:hypothetical protein U2A404250010 [Corynebacterium striatum]
MGCSYLVAPTVHQDQQSQSGTADAFDYTDVISHRITKYRQPDQSPFCPNSPKRSTRSSTFTSVTQIPPWG